jgi:hypothetical protein
MDRRKVRSQKARGQKVLEQVNPPNADGWMSALLSPGEVPKDHRHSRVLEIPIGMQIFRFLWNAQCKVCRTLRDPGSGRPKFSTGPLVYETINNRYIAGDSMVAIHQAIIPMMDGWPEDEKIIYKNIAEHTSRHIPVEVQARQEVVAMALQTFGTSSLPAMSATGLAYLYSIMGLREGISSMLRGELIPRSMSDMESLTKVALTILRDYIGTAEVDEFKVFATRMDQAIVDAFPPDVDPKVVKKVKDAIFERFHELDVQGERTINIVRKVAGELTEGPAISQESPIEQQRAVPPEGPEVSEQAVSIEETEYLERAVEVEDSATSERAVGMKNYVGSERSRFEKSSVPSRRASASESPTVQEQAATKDRSSARKRANTPESSDRPKRAGGVESSSPSERAAAHESSTVQERADEKDEPVEAERAISSEKTRGQKRSTPRQRVDTRATNWKEPAENERAVATKRSSAGERAVAEESTLMRKRAIAEEGSRTQERAVQVEGINETQRAKLHKGSTDQERAEKSGESPKTSERAIKEESTLTPKRAIEHESTTASKRAAAPESAIAQKRASRADSDVANERAGTEKSSLENERASDLDSEDDGEYDLPPRDTNPTLGDDEYEPWFGGGGE